MRDPIKAPVVHPELDELIDQVRGYDVGLAEDLTEALGTVLLDEREWWTDHDVLRYLRRKGRKLSSVASAQSWRAGQMLTLTPLVSAAKVRKAAEAQPGRGRRRTV